MPRCQKVVIAADTAQFDGGIGRVAVRSAVGLRKAGCEVTYFCPIGGTAEELADAGVRIVNLGQTAPSEDPGKLRGMARGLWNGAAARELRALLADCDPADTVLHCHGYSKGLTPAIGPILTGGPVRHVYTMHEFFLSCPNGGFFDFPRGEICTRKPLGVACLTTNCDSRAALHKGWRVARQAILHGPGGLPRGLTDVITISDTQERIMRPALHPRTRVHRVSNPVDYGEQPAVAAGENDVFLFVGRLERDKGCLDFARAARAAGVRAVFVGAGSQEGAVREALPEARITGWVAPDEVYNWLGRARCLVFPSLWYETFGLVACEALRRGVPVITGGWNAAHEVVRHGETGLIYAGRDDLKDAIAAMTPAAATAMSKEAYRTRDRVGLSLDAHVGRLLAVYDGILDGTAA